MPVPSDIFHGPVLYKGFLQLLLNNSKLIPWPLREYVTSTSCFCHTCHNHSYFIPSPNLSHFLPTGSPLPINSQSHLILSSIEQAGVQEWSDCNASLCPSIMIQNVLIDIWRSTFIWSRRSSGPLQVHPQRIVVHLQQPQPLLIICQHLL